MICTTEFNKRLWEKEEPGLSITVIPNTISPVFAEYEEGKRESLREKYGLSGGDFVIGFAGRISEEKDWGYITGIVELDLINVIPGEGGGYVYAKNQHGKSTYHPDAVNVTLSPYNTAAQTYKRFT